MADKGCKISWKTKTSERYNIVGQQGTVRTRIARDREIWRSLTEGYSLQMKDTALKRIEQHVSMVNVKLTGALEFKDKGKGHN